MKIEYYENFDLKTIVTPVNVDRLHELLIKFSYNSEKTNFLVKGFSEGFSIGYAGPMNIKRNAPNLKLRVGNEIELWNKVMKEVRLKRFAGPFAEPPFEHYIQSPISLVPKDHGKATRLVFHLSYPCNGDSVNSLTPPDICKVKYSEFDDAVKRCIEEGIGCFIAKSDMTSAFRQLGIKVKHWPLLLLKAHSSLDQNWYYFVDKCLPFGSSISCAHFQAFSDAVAHIVRYLIKKKIINYFDDYMFAALLKALCNNQVKCFLKVCSEINFLVSMDKTFWGCTSMTFLGLLLDTINQVVCIPKEKVVRAQELIHQTLSDKKKKITLHTLQKICGYLNFLCRAIVPGRAFLRRLYSVTSGKLKPHHHISITREIRGDLTMWREFLNDQSVFCRPFMDFKGIYATDIDFYSDSSRNFNLGMGAVCDKSWMFMRWGKKVEQLEPSIEYLELFALTAAVLAWIKKFRNRRVYIFCDNMGVVHMINGSTLKCRNCMVLIRMITLESLKQNVRVFAKYVKSSENVASDALSRFEFDRFRRATKHKKMDDEPTPIPQQLLPIEKIWLA